MFSPWRCDISRSDRWTSGMETSVWGSLWLQRRSWLM